MAARKGKPYFEIGRAKIPLITSDQFKQGDAKLIAAVTGMDWAAWCKLLAKHGLEHAHVMQGFFAVAIQRARKLTIDEVVEFIDELPLINGIKLHVPKADDADPPTPEEDETAAT